MEFRVLQYFLAVTREQSISRAPEALHLSQPTLSRQLRDLEDELGKQLFVRGSRRITLTEEGMILRRRAEEIPALMQMAKEEVSFSNDLIAGDVSIGAGETEGVRYLARAARQLREACPFLRYHISSGDSTDVLESLECGLIDFGLLFGGLDTSKHAYITLPVRDTYGVLMRRDSPLAKKDRIEAADLWDEPIILNRNTKDGISTDGRSLNHWLQKDLSELNIVATYSLLYNGSLMVEEGVGYAL